MIFIQKLNFPDTQWPQLIKILVKTSNFVRIFVNFCQFARTFIQKDQNSMFQLIYHCLSVISEKKKYNKPKTPLIQGRICISLLIGLNFHTTIDSISNTCHQTFWGKTLYDVTTNIFSNAKRYGTTLFVVHATCAMCIYLKC